MTSTALRYKGRIFKPSGGSISTRDRVMMQRNKEKAVQLAQLRAMDRFAAGVYRTGGAYHRSNPQNHEETHYCDWGVTAVPTTAGGSTTMTCQSPTTAAPQYTGAATNSLVSISQGTGKNQRIGNKLHVYQMRMRGEIQLPAAQGSDDYLRIVLVLDKQANGTQAAAADVFEPLTVGPNVTDWQALRNMDNLDRFSVLKDKIIHVGQEVAVGAVPASAFVRKFFKMSHKCKVRIDYSSTTGATTELRSNNLFFIVFSSAGLCGITCTARIYWKE